MSLKPGHRPGQRTPLLPAFLFRPGTRRSAFGAGDADPQFIRIDFVVEYPEIAEPIMRESDRGSWFTVQAAWMPVDAWEDVLAARVRGLVSGPTAVDADAAPAIEFAAARFPADRMAHVVSLAEAVAWSKGRIVPRSRQEERA